MNTLNQIKVKDTLYDIEDVQARKDLLNRVEKVDGKELSSNDFTNEYKEKLDGLSNYDDTQLRDYVDNAIDNIELPTGSDTNYRLITKIVFDETNQTNTILITQDMEGNPLELSRVFMCADWKAHESKRADAWLNINNANYPYIFCIETTEYKYIVQADAFDGFCYLDIDTKITGTAKAGGKAIYLRDMNGFKINQIRWTTGVNIMPPVGSVLTVYGY